MPHLLVHSLGGRFILAWWLVHPLEAVFPFVIMGTAAVIVAGTACPFMGTVLVWTFSPSPILVF